MMGVVSDEEDGFPWSLGVFDAHCHPTDTMSSVPDISKMRARALTVMATRAQDQKLVADVADAIGLTEARIDQVDAPDWRGIIPSFGWHPWFSHQIYDDEDYHLREGEEVLSEDEKNRHYQVVLDPPSEDRAFNLSLPDPKPLSTLISETSARLEQHPLALVGEIGLDKAFCIPEAWLPEQVRDRDTSLTPGGRESRRLSRYRVSLAHQKKIFLAQLKLAGRIHRPVSVHGVQAHGHLFETLRQTWRGQENPSKRSRKRQQNHPNELEDGDEGSSTKEDAQVEYPPRICLHSYSGPPDTLKQYFHATVPTTVFFSFSTAINFSSSAVKKTEAVIKALPDDRILVESDLHIAGTQMDAHLKDVVKRICELKLWTVEDGVRQLGSNWKAFVLGQGD